MEASLWQRGAQAALAALALAACTASNPGRPQESRWRDPQANPAPAPARAEPGAAPAEAARGAAEAPAGPAPLVVARVGGRSIDAARLFAAWMHYNSRDVADLLERLVTAETLDLEAARLGVSARPEAVEERYAEVLADIESGLRERGLDLTVDEWIAAGLNLGPDGYRRRLREECRRQVLVELVVRRHVLTNERAIARIVVSETRAEIEAVRAAHAAGRSFEELARERSMDPSSKDGGLLPPLLRSSTPVSRLAFLTGAGEVGGPIQMLDGENWLLLRVESIEAPLEGPWSRIGPEVERSVAERPIHDYEYVQWKAEMVQHYPADLEPFFQLVDGVRP